MPAAHFERALGDPPPDCQSCGACCFSNLQEYIRVFGIDRDRMGELTAQHTHSRGDRCFMRMRDGHCAALGIDAQQRRFSCTIYAVRPDACRSLIAGSGACLGELREKRNRALLAIEELLAQGR